VLARVLVVVISQNVRSSRNSSAAQVAQVRPDESLRELTCKLVLSSFQLIVTLYRLYSFGRASTGKRLSRSYTERGRSDNCSVKRAFEQY
jgi:hypothetical protein